MIQRKSLKQYKEIFVIACLLVTLIFATASTPNIVKPINAQPLDFTKNLAVYMTIFGLNDTTGQILAFVKTHDMIKSALVNGSQLFATNNKTPGIAEVNFVLQNLTLKAGEQYTGCVVVLKDTKMICVADFKAPYPRPQILDISIQ